MNTRQIGQIGELVVVEYLQRERYKILATNYRSKLAEIDIICTKKNSVHFVEVKSVSHKTKEGLKKFVLHETYQPEELVDHRKLHKLNLGIKQWLLRNNYKGKYQVDVATAHLVLDDKYAYIKVFKQVSLGH